MDDKAKSTTRQKFYQACRTIVRHDQVKCLNYCVSYADAGLSMWKTDEIDTQVLYILSNMNTWRGDAAKETRKLLKEVQNELR